MPWAARLAIGPALTLLAACAILALARVGITVPNPGVITFVTVAFAAYIGGWHSALLSALISIVFAAILFSTPGHYFTPDSLTRVLVMTVGTITIVAMVAALRRRATRSLEDQRARTAELENAASELAALRGGLDKIEDGIVLLDGDLRAQFINPAFRRIFRLPQEIADEKPTFSQLMYHGRDTQAYAVASDDLDAYIADRMSRVRHGDEAPLDLRLTDGEVVRFKCKTLPTGGRLLTYVNVSDIVRHNDRLETLRAALDQIDEGVVLLDRGLRTEFMNRAARELGGLREPGPGERPPFADLARTAAQNAVYNIPPDELEAFVDKRIDWVKRGDPGPQELRMSSGKIMHVRCIMLRDGARMLTYTDVTDLVRLAEIDSLTGLYNRRQFLALAEQEWTRFRRYERPLSLLMMDIDFFKSINDRFGHDAGDKVIAGVANVCITTARSTDLLGRLGGEELALLLPETDLRSATHVAERLRLRIVEETIRVGGEWIPVTASIGVAEASLTVGSFPDLMKRADAALYAAKRNGRNRVEAMSAELEESMIDE
jgi:diguanylate cyclase (GGDEF)-like protein